MKGQEREAMLELIAFLPTFEKPGLTVSFLDGGERDADGVINMPYTRYIEEMETFFKLVFQSFFNPHYSRDSVDRVQRDPVFIEGANAEQLQDVLSWLARGERLCDGLWAPTFSDGTLVRILRRLKTLAAEEA
jgi:hypothetical protein